MRSMFVTRLRRALRQFSNRSTDERGAMLVFASISMAVVVGSTALAVDLGSAVTTNRSLQAAVDLAALDAVRAVGDRHGQGGGLSTQQFAEKLAKESLARNEFDPDNATLGNSYTVVLGEFDPTTRAFTPSADPTAQNAVKVTANTTRDWTFMPGDKAYSAFGIAALAEEAGIAVGSFLARVDGSTGLLNSVLGGFLGGNLTLVGYTGLAAGSVSLGSLKTELAVGTVDELLDTNITVGDLLTAMASALAKQGDAASLAARSDVLTLASTVNSSLQLKLGDLIKVAQGSEKAALATKLNVFQLITMAAQVANGQNAISLTLSTASLGGLGSLLNPGGNTLSLKVIEPPQIAIGPARQDADGKWVTEAKTAQVRLQVNLRPLGTVLGGVLNLPIYVEAASAKASLRGIDCGNPIDDSTVTVHTDTQAVRARVATVNNISAATPTVSTAVILNIVGLVRVEGSADINLASAASDPDLQFNGPFDWSNTQTVGSSSLALGALIKSQPLALNLIALGLPLGLGSVLSDTLAILNPILDVVDDGLLDPLLANLGVSLGGGDVTAWHLDCDSRALVG